MTATAYKIIRLDYKYDRSRLDEEHMLALAAIETEYQANCKPIQAAYRARFRSLGETLETTTEAEYEAQVEASLNLRNETLAPITTAYAQSVYAIDTAYFASVRALSTRFNGKGL